MEDKPIFKKDSLNLYTIIEEPCSVIVKVANTVFDHYKIDDGNKSRYIVNLRVSTEEKLKKVTEIIGIREYCYFDEVKNYFLSGTLWSNHIQDITNLPTKGENIIATFDYIDNELKCVSLTLIPRKTLRTFDPSAYDESKKLLKLIIKNE